MTLDHNSKIDNFWFLMAVAPIVTEMSDGWLAPEQCNKQTHQMSQALRL